MQRTALTVLATSLLAAGLTACGDSRGTGGSIVPPTQNPAVSFINAPTSVRVGQATPPFTVQVSVPGGARSSQFIELETFNPSGARIQNQFFNPQQVNCNSGSTFCSFNTDFFVQFGQPTGVWQFRVTAFDQQNRSGSQTLFITVFQ
ncbi:hypothetical protein L1047_11365 [Synechococcus sp. Nb3U1]|uniref:hypothetical protein n=1 Tax=Synechococcus sp. Nb3U1 TaxID=1914529 RepID=UPI001F16933F|nr:hypothetical protein [Synechococcus sp. Nb3U1]MCF2971793.1 hypothetical protein [Synechococcus sp. Nb3U1]